MADASWFSALTNGYPPADAELHAAATDYAGIEAAWNSDEPALLIWLAARLAPTVEDLRAVVATTAALVEQRLHHIDTPDLTLAALVAQMSEMAGRALDRQALSHATTLASVHRRAASALHNVLTAAVQLTKVKDPTSPLVRDIPSLLASAVDHANSALGNYVASSGGPFTSLSGGGELIRSRHDLIDGQVRAKP